MLKRIYSFLFLFFTLLIFNTRAYNQIPIAKFYPSILHIDSTVQKKAKDSSFDQYFNRWVQVGDMDGDGLDDIVLQPYLRSSRDGIVSIFYNKSKDGIPKFINNTNSTFMTLGDPSQFTIGDIDGDKNLDLYTPTQNYHGTLANKPIWLYPNGGDITPSIIWLQKSRNVFQKIVFPDTIGSESGNLYSTKNGTNNILVSSYQTPLNLDPNRLDANLIYNYKLQSNSLIRTSTFFGANRGYFLRVGSLRYSNEKYDFFALEKVKNDGTVKNNWVDSLLILSFKKGDSLSILNPYDTIAIIKYDTYTKRSSEYSYRPVNDWGVFVTDLDHDGNFEVITQEFAYSTKQNDTIPGRIQVYNKKGNISNLWLDSAIQYDPQIISHGNGITVTDLNGDGYEDILPFTGWGWWWWSNIQVAKSDPEFLKKGLF